MSRRVDPAITVMLREYAALRGEVVAALSHRLQIWSFGAGAIAVLLAGALTAIAEVEPPGSRIIHTVAGVIIALVVPLFCLAVFVTWLGEVRRGRRASWHLWGIERHVNARLGVRALSWEEDLRDSPCQQMRLVRNHHSFAMLFFTAAAVCSAAGGLAFLLHPESGTMLSPLLDDQTNTLLYWSLVAAWGLPFLVPCAYWFRAHETICERCQNEKDPSWPEAIPRPCEHCGREMRPLGIEPRT